MKKASLTVVCLALVGGIGWLGWLYTTPSTDLVEANWMMPNNPNPVDYKLVPAGFETVTPNLFRKKLTSANKKSVTGKFEKVTDSGIKFKNFLDRGKAFQNIETGSGVAIGDYNSDGLPDVYLLGTDVSNKLYKNLGDFKFEDATEQAGVNGLINLQNAWSSGATFADVDNDGDLDLLVCNMAGPNLLYINQNDGTFVEQSIVRHVNYSGASKIGSFCDYDRDGDLDFYLVTYQDRPSTEKNPIVKIDGKDQIREDLSEYFDLIDGHQIAAGELDILYRNNGDGTFEQVTEEAGLSNYDMGLSCLWFDHDNDGWQDLYVTTDYKKPDHLYRNNGDGTFTDILPDVAKHTPWFSMGSDSGDFNNDGLTDLMTVDMSGRSHYKQKMDMGSMGNSGWFLKQGSPRQYMKNCMFLNSGVGPYFEAASITGTISTDWSWAARIVDLDNDGWQDLFVTNGHARDLMNGDMADKFDAMKKKGYRVEEWDALYVSIPARKEANLAFKNQGGLNFESAGSELGLDHTGVSHGAAFADLDSDGDLDLVVNNYYEPSLIYRNNAAKGLGIRFEFRCDENNFFGIGTKIEIWQGELYQMRHLNTVRGYLSSDEPVVHFGTSSDATIERAKITWPDATVQEFSNLEPGNLYRVIESTNRSADRKLPLKTMFVDSAQVLGLEFQHTERPFDDFAREPLLPFQLSELGGGVAWGDANSDGWPDLYVGGAAGQSGILYLNRSGKNFERAEGPWSLDQAQEDMGILFFDADSDGDQDLYVVSGSNECEANDPILKDRLYLNLGDGKFEKSSSVLPDVADSGCCVTANDFDRDGDLDLFVGSRAIAGRYPLTPISRLLRNDAGKFVDVTDQVADGLSEVGLVNSATWSDYNNDGWYDLIVAVEWGPVTFFKNVEGNLINETKELGLDEKLGWWHGITAADLDDDGDLDYLVTNHGLNTKYHASKKRPIRLYYDDFDGNGQLDLVEAEFEGDTEYPVRGRSCSSSTMPFIAEKFGTYHEFALASLDDIYEPESRKTPYRELNYLDSAIFWNENGETFSLEALPRLAQISPAFGAIVSDFDGDGILDIFLANNFFASQPETGYMDGGLSLLLKGNGARKFEPIWPNQSGVAINAPAYSAATADFDKDGDQDIVVGTNNDKIRLLENQANNDRPIRLVSGVPQSNLRFPIGTRIKLKGKDFQRVIETRSGDGYQSQSFGEVSIPKRLADRIETVEVTWPGGTMTRHPFQPADSVMEIVPKK